MYANERHLEVMASRFSKFQSEKTNLSASSSASSRTAPIVIAAMVVRIGLDYGLQRISPSGDIPVFCG
jgi:hypothetical protein